MVNTLSQKFCLYPSYTQLFHEYLLLKRWILQCTSPEKVLSDLKSAFCSRCPQLGTCSGFTKRFKVQQLASSVLYVAIWTLQCAYQDNKKTVAKD